MNIKPNFIFDKTLVDLLAFVGTDMHIFLSVLTVLSYLCIFPTVHTVFDSGGSSAVHKNMTVNLRNRRFIDGQLLARLFGIRPSSGPSMVNRRDSGQSFSSNGNSRRVNQPLSARNNNQIPRNNQVYSQNSGRTKDIPRQTFTQNLSVNGRYEKIQFLDDKYTAQTFEVININNQPTIIYRHRGKLASL